MGFLPCVQVWSGHKWDKLMGDHCHKNACKGKFSEWYANSNFSNDQHSTRYSKKIAGYKWADLMEEWEEESNVINKNNTEKLE